MGCSGFKARVIRSMEPYLVLWIGVWVGAGCSSEGPWISVGLDDSPSVLMQPSHHFYRPVLGVGVDFSETKTFRRCVTTPVVASSPGFATRLYNELAVQTRNDLNEALHIDASLSAKGLWGGISGRASSFKNVQMSSDAFYWLVSADYHLMDEGIDTGDPSFQLTDEAKRILQGPRGLEGFYEACGAYFYSGHRLGAHYALLYEFKSHEQKTMDRIRAAAGYSGWGVKARASFENLTEMAQRASVLKIYASSQGGSDRLASYATQPEELERELATLRDDLYNHHKGVEVEWFISDYNIFPEIQEAKAIVQQPSDVERAPPGIPKMIKDNALARLYTQFMKNIDLQQQMTARLEQARSVDPLYGYSPEKQARMREILRYIDVNNIDIGIRAQDCLYGSMQACKVQDLLEASIQLDGQVDAVVAPDEDYTTLQGWSLVFEKNENSAHHFHFLGKPPYSHGSPIKFVAGYSISDSPLGMRACADEGPEIARLIGDRGLVQDPYHGQMRPNVCVYNYQEICSLRIVKLPVLDERGDPCVKLQMVLFDSYGFIEKRLDFPAAIERNTL